MPHHRLPLALAALALISTAATGCARPSAPVTSPAPPPSGQATAVEAMTAEQKRSLIATNFPLEVPVPSGDVRRGQAQGTDAWDYEVDIDAPLADVDAWFQEAYRSRNWQLSGRSQADGSVSLTFVKAVAQSGVALTENGEGTRAVVVLGVGAPVLESQ